jgi:hypothetical protein
MSNLEIYTRFGAPFLTLLALFKIVMDYVLFKELRNGFDRSDAELRRQESLRRGSDDSSR